MLLNVARARRRARARQGAFPSRMSHSCTPNCQAVVMACGGRLTIAVYTLRRVAPGEELTFDYASVTESEKEFRCATCLCGTRLCRGSFLYFAGSRAFMQARLAARPAQRAQRGPRATRRLRGAAPARPRPSGTG
jgi:hypothetical protein